MSGTVKRSQLIAKPSFQYKLIIIFMLLITFTANLVGLLSFFFITHYLDNKMDDILDLHKLGEPTSALHAEIARDLVPKIVIAEAATLILVFYLCIWVTHKIGGPLYRMEQVAKQIGEGDLEVELHLRPHDELKDLATALNTMCEGIAGKIRRIQQGVDDLEKRKGSEPELEAVKKTLAEFKVPPPREAPLTGEA